MIFCLGEALIDFIPTEARDGSLCYRPAEGGAIRNVALALARLGVPVGFVGGVSTDFFGDALANGLAKDGVSLSHLSRLDRPTTLAFVRFEAGEARYAFYDADAADRQWRLVDMAPIGPEVQALHFGGISLLRQPAAGDFTRLMEGEATRRTIGLDANIRPNLVRDGTEYRARLDRFLRNAHIIKVSDADLDWMAPGVAPDELAARWLSWEARLVVVTRGGDGATIYARNATVSRRALPVRVADTVGAGDAFMAGLFAGLQDGGGLDRERLAQLDRSEMAEILHFALAVAAVTVSRIGADPPRRADLARFLEEPG